MRRRTTRSIELHYTAYPLYNENDEDCCEEMTEKYDWQLVDVEKTGDPVLPVDCVFEGETQFPKSYYDTDKEQD